MRSIYVMRKKTFLALSILSLIGLTLLAVTPQERLAIIKALKSNGTVGENNVGLVEFKGEKKASEIVAEENAERTKIYKAIAEKQGVSVDQVGKERAVQIAKDAEKGVWIQSPDGSWQKKK